MNVEDILSDLDDHGFDDNTTERKMAVINETYWDVCGLEPWPFLEKTVTLTFDGSSGVPVELQSVATLTDLHAVLSMRNNEVSGSLGYIDYDDFNQGRPVTLITGTARYFYFESGTLTVYPIPASSATIKLSYISTPPELGEADTAAAILLPAQYHRAVLVNGALVKLYALEEDLDIAAGFKAFHDEAIARMREFMFRRQYQRNMVVVPADLDDLDD